MHDDDKWVSGLREGDPGAYEKLVTRFEGTLYTYFLTSHGDPQLAGEQSADCFGELVRAFRKMKGGPEQIRPFVLSVARNVLRRRWRRATTVLAPLEAAANVMDRGASPHETASYREELTRFLEALNELDRETREVFVLRYIEQLSLDEVATVVGEPLGTVKSRVHRGRERLKELIKSVDVP
jgi:RNA polymerase sigma-70 factor (ECF subfamily)